MPGLPFRPRLKCLIVGSLCGALAACGSDTVATHPATPSATASAASARDTTTPPSDPSVVGSWSSVGGAYLVTYEYRADGMSLQHVGDTTRGPWPYRIEGDSIVVTVTLPSGRVVGERTRFSIADDTLTLVGGDGETRDFQRTASTQ